MTKSRLIIMIGGGLALALVLFAGVSFSDRIDEPGTGADSVDAQTAASLTPVTVTRVSEVLSDGRPVLRLSGIAEPSAVIVLLDRGEAIRQVRTTPQGVWSATIDVTGQGMAIEAIMFDVGASEEAFNADSLPPSENVAGVTSIRGQETIFRIHRPTELQPDSPALVMISAPGAPTRLIQSPFGGLPSEGPLAIGAIDYDDSGGVIVSGLSEVPGRVRLYVSNAAIGETRVGPDGRWSYIASSVMPLGEYDVRAELLGWEGGQPSVSVPFERLPPLPDTGTDDGALSVNFESFRWQIRRSLVGGGLQSTAIFAPE